jgi:hypothetical protein
MVLGITGHQDIPHAAKKFAKDRIADVLCRIEGGITGVSSLASGADQLFARIVVRIGAELHVIIPCEGYEATFTSKLELNQYREKANRVEMLNHKEPSQAAFLDAGHRVVDVSEMIVAVWDGLDARGRGGTADIVRYAKERGKEVVVVWPPGLSRSK